MGRFARAPACPAKGRARQSLARRLFGFGMRVPLTETHAQIEGAFLLFNWVHRKCDKRKGQAYFDYFSVSKDIAFLTTFTSGEVICP